MYFYGRKIGFVYLPANMQISLAQKIRWLLCFIRNQTYYCDKEKPSSTHIFHVKRCVRWHILQLFEAGRRSHKPRNCVVTHLYRLCYFRAGPSINIAGLVVEIRYSLPNRKIMCLNRCCVGVASASETLVRGRMNP